MNKTKTLIASTDREMLDYLMQAFDSEMGVCERCGHEESTATCDSATFLRDYLAAYPAPTAGDEGSSDARERLAQLREWSAATGALPTGGSWIGELEAIVTGRGERATILRQGLPVGYITSMRYVTEEPCKN